MRRTMTELSTSRGLTFYLVPKSLIKSNIVVRSKYNFYIPLLRWNSWSRRLWVVVIYKDDWYPGEVSKIDDTLQVKCMKKIKDNKLVLPEREDLSWYTYKEVLCSIHPPAPATAALRSFCLAPNDLLKIWSKLRQWILISTYSLFL